ncbi:MAG: hypothetical protein JW882_09155 [Deltaproteobacteria bacterium]|nr:hypothetical protein [Deltaproteobacteria bacterium]
MSYKWIPILGEFSTEKDTLIFKGGSQPMEDGRLLYNVGNFICNQAFGNGIISGEIEFTTSIENEACGFILYFHPSTKAFTMVGLGAGGALCSVQTWSGNQWVIHSSAGEKLQLKTGHPYNLQASVVGSRVTVNLEGVDVVITDLPFPLPTGQAGVWCMGGTGIKISRYNITRQPPKAFVVMQFTPPYNELYSDVIAPVCQDLGLIAVRADETYGPGLIIADIVRDITEAKVIIAEITPANPNVYYEVGYAHALNKPTILIAEKPTQLPFDVSPFRVLFYENTIGGKAKIESGLRKHLEAIQRQWTTT